MNICEHLTVTAKLFPDRTAVVFEGHRISYSQLDVMSQSAAGGLSAAGVTRGDRVAVMLPNIPAFVVWYYAAPTYRSDRGIRQYPTGKLRGYIFGFRLRRNTIIALPETIAVLTDSLPDCITNCVATSVIGDQCNNNPLPTLGDELRDSIEMQPDDAAVILYTSGTTGFAKGATLSHLNVRSNVHAFNHLCNMQPEDRILLAVPLFHCFGQNALLNSAFNVGATLVLQRKFDPHESIRLIRDEQVTQLYGVPMMFQMFLESCGREDLASVGYCFSAAAQLPIQTGQRWQGKFDMPIHEGYGLTETSPFASYNHRLKFVPGSIGTPINCVEMKIVDLETGEQCPPGKLGEIAIRGPNVMLGYWNQPRETADAIRDGWFHSGDIGRQDETGFFYIVDRVKDMISVGGLKVYPAEVERVVLDHPNVSQAAVVGRPDAVFGEQVVAFVVLSEKPNANQESIFDEVLDQARSQLAHYKVPRQVIALDELPRNPSGKILKTKLRQMDLTAIKVKSGPVEPAVPSGTLADPTRQNSLQPPILRRQLESTHVASRKETANLFVQELVRSISSSESLPDPETRFLDAGLDSLMIVEMSSQLQSEFGSERQIPATLVFDHPRISDLAEFLVESLVPAGSGSHASASARSVNPLLCEDGEMDRRVEAMTEQQVLEELMKEIDS